MLVPGELSKVGVRSLRFLFQVYYVSPWWTRTPTHSGKSYDIQLKLVNSQLVFSPGPEAARGLPKHTRNPSQTWFTHQKWCCLTLYEERWTLVCFSGSIWECTGLNINTPHQDPSLVKKRLKSSLCSWSKTCIPLGNQVAVRSDKHHGQIDVAIAYSIKWPYEFICFAKIHA